jgi:hypothetical protein
MPIMGRFGPRRCTHVYGAHPCGRPAEGYVSLVFPPHGPRDKKMYCNQHIHEVTQYPPRAGEWKVER